MRCYLFISLFCLGQVGFSQPDLFSFFQSRKEVDTQNYIHYYSFHKGVQMIKIDHNRLFEDRARASDPWNAHRMSSAPPSYYQIRRHPYSYPTYIFRDTQGQILNCHPSRDYRCQFNLLKVDSCPISYHIQTAINRSAYYARQPNSDSRFLYIIRDELGKFGLMDSLGDVCLAPNYDSILFRNGTYLIREGSSWGLLDGGFKQTSRPCYDKLVPLGKEHFLAEMGECFGVVDLNGREVVALKYEAIQFMKRKPNLFTFRKKGELGVMDSAFEVVQPATYAQIQPVGMVYRVLLAKNNRFGLLDPNGKELLPPVYNDIHTQGSYNLLIRKYDGDSAQNFYGLLDRFGNTILPVEYEVIYWVRHKQHFIVRKGTNQFVIDRNGQIIKEE